MGKGKKKKGRVCAGGRRWEEMKMYADPYHSSFFFPKQLDRNIAQMVSSLLGQCKVHIQSQHFGPSMRAQDNSG